MPLEKSYLGYSPASLYLELELCGHLQQAKIFRWVTVRRSGRDTPFRFPDRHLLVSPNPTVINIPSYTNVGRELEGWCPPSHPYRADPVTLRKHECPYWFDCAHPHSAQYKDLETTHLAREAASNIVI